MYESGLCGATNSVNQAVPFNFPNLLHRITSSASLCRASIILLTNALDSGDDHRRLSSSISKADKLTISLITFDKQRYSNIHLRRMCSCADREQAVQCRTLLPGKTSKELYFFFAWTGSCSGCAVVRPPGRLIISTIPRLEFV